MNDGDTVLCSMEAPAFPERYGPIRELARGGMGAVWRVRDRNLDRDLAAKVLLPRTAAVPALVARFLREARVMASLQHPGIPPVGERGELADGSPFFTMKLVEGETLAAVLGRSTNSSKDRARLLAVFEQVAQTLAFAHGQGVVHRDLKPLNVMVGAFGEVQVMDWGAAKVVGRDAACTTANGESGFGLRRIEDAEPRPEDTVVGDSGLGGGSDFVGDTAEGEHLTRAGDVMGTFGYMAPEQARGEHDRIGARADVFSLGAMLCEVLTGQPPYVGEDRWQQARAADLAPAHARLDRCKAALDLVALCRDCLTAEPDRRPADAAEVAGRVSAFRAAVDERLRSAERKWAVAEAKEAEERKRQRLARGLAAAVVALLVGAGVHGWGYREDRQAEAAAAAARAKEVLAAVTKVRADVVDGLERAARLRDEGRWDEARSLLDAAERRLEKGSPAELRDALALARLDLDTSEALDEIHLGEFDIDFRRDFGDPLYVSIVPWEYARAFGSYGFHVAPSDADEAATDAFARRVTSSAIAPRLIEALDDWALHERDAGSSERLLAVARAADADPWRDRLRDSVIRSDPTALAAIAAETDPATLRPRSLHVLIGLLQRNKAPARSLLARSLNAHPGDFWLLVLYGRELLAGGPEEKAEAAGLLRGALAVRPEADDVRVGLGKLYLELGRPAEASAVLQEKTLGGLDSWRLDFVTEGLMMELGRGDEADASLRGEIADLPSAARIRSKLGMVLWRVGKLEAAEAECREAVRLAPERAGPRHMLGRVLFRMGRFREAEAECREAARLDPSLPLAQMDLGLCLSREGRFEDAAEAFRESIRRGEISPTCHAGLANALSELGRQQEAVAALRAGVVAFPRDGRLRLELARRLGPVQAARPAR